MPHRSIRRALSSFSTCSKKYPYIIFCFALLSVRNNSHWWNTAFLENANQNDTATIGQEGHNEEIIVRESITGLR
jgi:hypothetical protein